jgi:acyl-coenzyme A synthetase/AMP-(fatty) acid ligase/acyl carrier protein
MASYSSISFDFTLTSLFIPLLTSGAVHMIVEKDLQLMLNEVVTNPAARLAKLTPAHIELLKIVKPKQFYIEKIIIGGDRLLNSHITFLRLLNPKIEIFNEYGPTEATVGSSVLKVKNEVFNGSIGTSISNTKILILDNDLNMIPKLAIGEICISGSGLGRAYLNREELTKEKYVENPYSIDKTDKFLYRTGDLARYLDNGEIEYIGRNDDQIKIRGNRIEIREIENTILTFEDVNEVAVVVKKNDNDTELIAYVSGSKTLKIEDLRRFLLKKIMVYMIPSQIFMIERLPLNQNGKVDRKKLETMFIDQVEADGQYLEARNEIDQKLITIWKSELNRKKIGIQDNFFSLGGHSLKAIRILNKIEEQFQIKFSANELYEYQTIEMLSDKISLSLYLEDSDKDSSHGKVLLI